MLKSVNIKSQKCHFTFHHFIQIVLIHHLKLHETHVGVFYQLFQEYDKDQDSNLSQDEFRSLLESMNLPMDYFERLVMNIDPFGHNKVSFSDCIHFMTNELIEI